MTKKISELTAATVAAVANELEINEAGTSKKVTVQQLIDLLLTLGMPRIKRLGAQFLATVNSITKTSVTGLLMTLPVGTYTFQYSLNWKTNDATNGISVNVNFTGTSGIFVYWWRWVDVSATAATAAADQDAILATGSVMGVMARRIKATTAVTGIIISADTVNADMMLIVEGLFIATGAGDLELWAGNDAAGAGDQISIEVGSSLVVIQTA